MDLQVLNDLALAFVGATQIIHWSSAFWSYNGKCYDLVSPELLDFQVRQWLIKNAESACKSAGDIKHLITQIGSVAHRDGLRLPCWITGPGKTVINLANGLFDPITKTVEPHTWKYFSTASLPYSYDPAAKCPAWSEFLKQVLVDDDQIALLQTWFGYCLTQDAARQKAMVFYGPPRSGKGTTCHILTKLIGFNNVASPSLQSLSSQFGLHSLIGKTVGIVGEIEIGKEGKAVVQTLKGIIGNDAMTIQRKYQPDLNMVLPIRFVLCCNRIPRLPDASNALAARLLWLHFPNSFLGKEDLALQDRLQTEMPGILNWALEGLQRLSHAGRFVQSERAKGDIEEFADAAAPVLGFVDLWCSFQNQMSWTASDDLYLCWCNYANKNGFAVGCKQTFILALKAAFPILKRSRRLFGEARPYGYEGIGLQPHAIKLIAANNDYFKRHL